jgi:hypothetical protein
MGGKIYVGRREVCLWISLGLMPLLGLKPLRGWAADIRESAGSVSFEWRVPVAQYDLVKSNLQFDGDIKTESDTKGLPFVFIFIGLTLLPSLADAVLKVRNKLIRPGVKIDARDKDVKVEIDPSLPKDTILTVDGTGAKLYDRDEIPDAETLVQTLGKSLGNLPK